MGYEQPLFKVGLYPSDTDRSQTATNQFYAVSLGTAQNVVGTGQGNAAIVAPTAGGTIFGILQNNPIAGEACELTCMGISKAKATGSFSVGAALSIDAAGGFVAQSGSAAVVALACEQAVAGDVTSVYLK